MNDLPEILRAWRTRHAYTQKKAAARIGVPMGTLLNWEQGRRAPRGLALHTLLKRCLPRVPKHQKRKRKQTVLD